MSTVRSRSQAPAASIVSCRRACSSRSLSISSASTGSPSLVLISSKRRSRARVSATAFLDVAAHVLGRVELGLLRQEPDAEPVGGERLTEEVVVDSGHDPEQGALARAVGAQHADLGAGQERQPDAPAGSPASGGTTLRRSFMTYTN